MFSRRAMRNSMKSVLLMKSQSNDQTPRMLWSFTQLHFNLRPLSTTSGVTKQICRVRTLLDNFGNKTVILQFPVFSTAKTCPPFMTLTIYLPVYGPKSVWSLIFCNFCNGSFGTCSLTESCSLLK